MEVYEFIGQEFVESSFKELEGMNPGTRDTFINSAFIRHALHHFTRSESRSTMPHVPSRAL